MRGSSCCWFSGDTQAPPKLGEADGGTQAVSVSRPGEGWAVGRTLPSPFSCSLPTPVRPSLPWSPLPAPRPSPRAASHPPSWGCPSRARGIFLKGTVALAPPPRMGPSGQWGRCLWSLGARVGPLLSQGRRPCGVRVQGHSDREGQAMRRPGGRFLPRRSVPGRGCLARGSRVTWWGAPPSTGRPRSAGQWEPCSWQKVKNVATCV